MYSCLKIREPLNGFLSVLFQGKCTLCKSKIHHPKSLILSGASGEDQGHGHKHGSFGDKGGWVALMSQDGVGAGLG